jgi:hypothetical protein
MRQAAEQAPQVQRWRQALQRQEAALAELRKEASGPAGI